MEPLDNAVTEFISININSSFCQEGPQCQAAPLDISADRGLGELPDPVQPPVRHLAVLSHQARRHEIPVCQAKGLAGHLGPHLTESSLVSNHYRELIGSVNLTGSEK